MIRRVYRKGRLFCDHCEHQTGKFRLTVVRHSRYKSEYFVQPQIECCKCFRLSLASNPFMKIRITSVVASEMKEHDEFLEVVEEGTFPED